MANVIIKSEERREDERRVMRDFCVNPADKSRAEMAETVAAKSREAMQEMKRKEK